MFDSELIQSAWKHFDDHCSINKGVKNSIPILFFGNYEKYKASKLKVITVGKNPAKNEFEGERFEASQSVRDDQAAYVKTLSNYFSKNPYRWFNRFEKLLQHLQCTFFDNGYPSALPNIPGWCEQPNIALHTDICTPMATDPAWSWLSEETKEALSKEGAPLWQRLASYLEPDIILISVNEKHLKGMFSEWVNLGEPLPYGPKDKQKKHQPKYTDHKGSKVILLLDRKMPLAMKDCQFPEIAKRIKSNFRVF